ncbi:hypothetical protein E6W36_09625 [Hankyongella ginsenosidimutans]|uniref:Uncharacterized protein n=1 Tax=Hankyongella ginsenosidimutans TaxID=1763828 RepID=A0A4D7C1V7_9SPHN|nr:hypothetical protein [Hankyongella ginsenosidimutans]QCI79694.1 hypothetical protein E6W36_09625 [Hankyongella ginsenosidimutans]
MAMYIQGQRRRRPGVTATRPRHEFAADSREAEAAAQLLIRGKALSGDRAGPEPPCAACQTLCRLSWEA